MEQKINELEKWLEKASKYELPEWSTLPSVPLYMEQVTQYVNEVLNPLTPGDKSVLTSFMVNNYVKAGMIEAPEKKKYNVEHLGYLIAISSLKETLSMGDLSVLIEMDGALSKDKSVLYGFFKAMMNDISHDRAKTVLAKMESYEKRYDREKETDPKAAKDNLLDGVALTAFRLAIQSQINQTIARSLFAYLADELHGPKEREIETTPGHKELERAVKISEAESKRLALAKEAKAKEEKEAEQKRLAQEKLEKAEAEKKRIAQEKLEKAEAEKKEKLAAKNKKAGKGKKK